MFVITGAVGFHVMQSSSHIWLMYSRRILRRVSSRRNCKWLLRMPKQPPWMSQCYTLRLHNKHSLYGWFEHSYRSSFSSTNSPLKGFNQPRHLNTSFSKMLNVYLTYCHLLQGLFHVCRSQTTDVSHVVWVRKVATDTTQQNFLNGPIYIIDH